MSEENESFSRVDYGYDSNGRLVLVSLYDEVKRNAYAILL